MSAAMDDFLKEIARAKNGLRTWDRRRARHLKKGLTKTDDEGRLILTENGKKYLEKLAAKGA